MALETLTLSARAGVAAAAAALGQLHYYDALDAQEAFDVLCKASGNEGVAPRIPDHRNLARGWYKEALESRGELTTRLFGLPVASSIMTTTATVEGTDPAFASDTGASTLDLELTIGTTTAAQSTLAQSIPQAAGLLGPFPSGDALEMASKGSSKVTLRTTYLTESMRISRPILADGVADPRSVFVYTKEDL